MTNPKRVCTRREMESSDHDKRFVLLQQRMRNGKKNDIFLQMDDQRVEESFRRSKNFMKRVKEMSRETKHKGKYEEFLRLGKIYSEGCSNPEGLRDSIRVLFEDCEDLLKEFEWFCPKIPRNNEGLRMQHGLELDRVIGFMNRVQSCLTPSGSDHENGGDLYVAFVDVLTRFKAKDCCGGDDVKALRDELVVILRDHPALMQEFECIAFDSGGCLTEQRDSGFNAAKTYCGSLTPTQDIDVSTCEKVKESESYYVRPDELPEKAYEDKDDVINVKVFSRGDLGPYKQCRRRSQREIKMLEKEDVLFEEDMMLGRMDLAIEFAKDVLGNKKTAEKPPLGFNALVYELYKKKRGDEKLRELKVSPKLVLQEMLKVIVDKRASLLSRRYMRRNQESLR